MPSLQNLDLNLLKIFEAIYSSGSVSGAARKLGMSQPSISRNLNRLRGYFDDPLFERSGNGVAATAKAESMLESVREALALIGGTLDKNKIFDPTNEVRNFRMILPDFVEVQVIPSLVNRLPSGSQVTFEVLAFSNVDIFKALSNGEVDAGVVPFLPQGENITYRELFADSGALVAKRGHALLSNGLSTSVIPELKFITLPDYIFRLMRLDELLRSKNIQWQRVCTTHKISSMMQIVAASELVAFMPLSYANLLSGILDIDVFRIEELDMAIQHGYLAYSSTKEQDPGVNWLCSEIEAAFQE